MINLIKLSTEEVNELRRIMIHLYNSGYHAGHNDTVEGQYIDICTQDMDTYHEEIVCELVEEI